MNFADLPNNVEIEKAVLAALLLKNGAVIPKVSSILSVDDFYRTEHKIIFKTILKLFTSGSPIDVLSLLEELRRTKEIEKTGYELIYALANAGYTTAYAEHHASIVKEKSELRQLIYLSEKIIDDAEHAVKPVADIVASSQFSLSSLQHSSNVQKSLDFVDSFAHLFQPEIEKNKAFANRSTGFVNLDNLQIFSPGLYVIGATPAAGKTTFCWQLLEQLARNGETCIFCSYEMSFLELLCKSAARQLFIQDRHSSFAVVGTLFSILSLKIFPLPTSTLKSFNFKMNLLTTCSISFCPSVPATPLLSFASTTFKLFLTAKTILKAASMILFANSKISNAILILLSLSSVLSIALITPSLSLLNLSKNPAVLNIPLMLSGLCNSTFSITLKLETLHPPAKKFLPLKSNSRVKFNSNALKIVKARTTIAFSTTSPLTTTSSLVQDLKMTLQKRLIHNNQEGVS